MSHTPRPWHWVGNTLCNADWQTVLEVRDLPEHTVPELQSGQLVMPNEAYDKPLIAAAADLLEACELLYRLHAEGVFLLPEQHYRAITMTAAAIAKAEGTT